MIRRVACALLVGGLLETGAFGQSPPPLIAKPVPTSPETSAPAGAPAAPAESSLPSYHEPLPTDPAHPNYHPSAHRSIIRHNPLPHRTSYQSNYPYDRSAGGGSSSSSTGFSTGGVGRTAEYYDNQTLAAPIDHHPVPVGRFESGGGPNRQEQIQAYQAGTQRANSIQNNIQAYGRPYGAMGAGFGYGLGLAGGGLYTYPY